MSLAAAIAADAGWAGDNAWHAVFAGYEDLPSLFYSGQENCGIESADQVVFRCSKVSGFVIDVSANDYANDWFVADGRATVTGGPVRETFRADNFGRSADDGSWIVALVTIDGVRGYAPAWLDQAQKADGLILKLEYPGGPEIPLGLDGDDKAALADFTAACRALIGTQDRPVASPTTERPISAEERNRRIRERFD